MVLKKSVLGAVIGLFCVVGAGCASTGKAINPEVPVGEMAPPLNSIDAPAEETVEAIPEPKEDAKSPPKRPEGAARIVEVSDAASSALQASVSMMENDDLDGARRRLEGLLSDPKAAFLANYNLGVVSDREGKAQDAIAFFRESLRLNPDFSPALVSLCRIHLRMENDGLAIQISNKYMNERPENLNHLDARLQVLIAMGRFEEVIKDAKSILRRDERNVRAMVNLATAYHKLGKNELAEEVFRQVGTVTKDSVVLGDVQFQLGFVYLAMKKEILARGAFEKAVELRPDYVEAFNNLGVMYHRARDYESAVGQFERAIKVYPNYREAYLNLGNAHKGMRSYGDAEEAFKSLMKIDGKYAQAYFNMGVLYLDGSFEGRDKKEQFQLAIDNFNRYKMEMKSTLPRDDPSDDYIEEAKKKVELEIKKEQMRRESAMEAEDEEDFEDFEDFEDESTEDSEGDFVDDGGDDEDFEEVDEEK
jgi:tetratricopeptide (TPR) repeat protein